MVCSCENTQTREHNRHINYKISPKGPKLAKKISLGWWLIQLYSSNAIFFIIYVYHFNVLMYQCFTPNQLCAPYKIWKQNIASDSPSAHFIFPKNLDPHPIDKSCPKRFYLLTQNNLHFTNFRNRIVPPHETYFCSKFFCLY